MKTQQLMGIVIVAVVYSLGLCFFGPCFLRTVSALHAQQIPGARAAASAAREKLPVKAGTVNDAAGGDAEKKTTEDAAQGKAEEAAKAQEDAQKAAEEAEKKQQRLQKIQQLQFDRRRSTILKAWSEPEEKPKAAEKEWRRFTAGSCSLPLRARPGECRRRAVAASWLGRPTTRARAGVGSECR